MTTPAAGGLVPAQLGFLAIFNPSLGNTDETLDDQIVYYASQTATKGGSRRKRTRSHPTADISQEERNERLRQIGLAQGMVNFSRGFAEGAALDGIDTKKARVITQELEPGWWIIASIDLTKVPLPPRLAIKTGEQLGEEYEYSSKELKPATLLMSDLLRAHSTFLMHHDSSLSALFVRTKRSKFVAALSRYWDLFLSTWSVTLHGNPLRNVLSGINLAACGELGIGVGEEERGSGEREVLEGLVGRIEGLVDLVVSKFGDEEDERDSKDQTRNPRPWLGAGQEPEVGDGAIFLGAGALSRKSLKDLTHWMEDLYTWGERAYGVIEGPTSGRRAKNRRATKTTHKREGSDTPAAEGEPSKKPDEVAGHTIQPSSSPPQPEAEDVNTTPADDGKLDKMMGYLKMGYGSYWTIPGVSGESAGGPAKATSTSAASQPKKIDHPERLGTRQVSTFTQQQVGGFYLIGLKGGIEEDHSDGDSAVSDDAEAEQNPRTLLRTVHIELEEKGGNRTEDTIVKDFEHPASDMTRSQVMGNMLPGYNSHDLNKAEKLRVVVYVNRPFIFTFLFRLRTDSLAWESLYRSLHYQLAPLRKPLLMSTRYRPNRPDVGAAGSGIYDLVWDPGSLTVQSTIPNIPGAFETTWSRADAVSTHLHLLNMHNITRRHGNDLERTQKTSRGWWIVWTRLMRRADADAGTDTGGDQSPQNLSTILESKPADSESQDDEEHSRRESSQEPSKPVVSKEIFLMRRASDHAGARGSLLDTGGSDTMGKLVQGIGVDTKRYIEELLTLL